VKMKKIGIIGGMGSLATVHAFKRIIDRFDSGIDQNCPQIIIDNKSQVPPRVKAALTGEGKDEVISEINASLDLMRREKVDAVFIACNTAHVFFKEYCTEDLNLINMVKTTLSCLPDNKPAIILGTRGTISSKVFDLYNTKEIKLFAPDDELQEIIDKVILQIKKGELSEELDELLFSKLKNLSHNLIIACTELSMFSHKHGLHCYDALECAIEKVLK